MKDAKSTRISNGVTPWCRALAAVCALALCLAAGQAAERPVGFAYDARCLLHDTGDGHVERPARVVAIRDAVEAARLQCRPLPARPRDDALKWITSVHTEAYADRVRKSCERGDAFLDSPDTPVNADSFDAAVAAVGVVLNAVDAVMAGEVPAAFCAVRPPGHHAFADRAGGFCLFNNVAVAARYAQKHHGRERVLIVDWDVHHGNGTQAIFYEDPTVLYFGVHQRGIYPGTGAVGETGAGKGEGTTLNVPLPAGSGDAELIEAFERKLVPAALAFGPDFVIVSAGFDAHKDDPLGGMAVTAEGFAELTRIVRRIADECSEGRIVSVLEGGYDLDALAESAVAHVGALTD